jgi:AcrR family transcriptional regulator
MAQTDDGGWRRRRLTSEEVARKMLDVAAELIEARGGLSLSLEHINLEEIIQRAQVPRTSVYRIWPTKDHFLTDLMARLAGPDWHGTAAFSEETIEIVVKMYLDHWDELDTVDGRRRALREMVRAGASENYRHLCESRDWKTYVALIATLDATDGGRRSTLQEALQKSESAFVSRMSDFYSLLAPAVGLRLRPGVTYEHLAVLGAAVVEGLALYQGLRDEAALSLPATGEDQSWSLPAIGFLSVVDMIAELVPAAEWSRPNLEELMAGVERIAVRNDK